MCLEFENLVDFELKLLTRLLVSNFYGMQFSPKSLVLKIPSTPQNLTQCSLEVSGPDGRILKKMLYQIQAKFKDIKGLEVFLFFFV